MIRAAGHKVTYQSSKGGKWSKALKERADLIAIAGGDGTVGKVARRVMGRRVPLTILPMGTANNLANTLGLTGRNVKELIGEWNHAGCVNFDAGIATGPWGSRYFIEGFGMGLFAETLFEIEAGDAPDPSSKADSAEEEIDTVLRALGERLKKFHPAELTVRLDGDDLSGKFFLLEAMNTRYVGPNLDLVASAKFNDGLLDVVFVLDGERAKLKRYLSHMHDKRQSPIELPRRRGRHLQIEWPNSPVHIDDKHWPNPGKKIPIRLNAIDIKVDSGALVFLVPSAQKTQTTAEKSR